MGKIEDLQTILQENAEKTAKNSISPSDVFDNMREVLDCSTMVVTTWAELKAMRDAGELVAGQFYRITDYVCTVDCDKCQSAEHQFDIIVTATSESTLNENALAALHDGDDYFANCKLDAWEIKYCLDNDRTRFAWADVADGHGVVWYMKDEHNNVAFYDFKSVQFLRFKITSVKEDAGLDTLVGTYMGIEHSGDTGYDIDADDFRWVYTFDFNYGDADASVIAINETLEEEFVDPTSELYNYIHRPCACNTIMPSFANLQVDGECNMMPYSLGNNVLMSSTDNNEETGYQYFNGAAYNTLESGCYDNTLGQGTHSNTLGQGANSNTLGQGAYSNTIGQGAYSNTLGQGAYFNTLGQGAHNNTLGEWAHSNTLGQGAHSNTLGQGANNNTLGEGANNNTLGEGAYSNTIGQGAYSNTLEQGAHSNILGQNANSNTLGQHAFSNTLGQDARSNTLGQGAHSNTLGEWAYSNTIGQGAYSNTLGQEAYSNTLGEGANNNTLGNGAHSNTIGEGAHSNTIGERAHSNTLGQDANSNTIGQLAHSNTLEQGANSNTLEQGANSNTIGQWARFNTLGQWAHNNTLGEWARFNTLGQEAQYNTLGQRAHYNILENGCGGQDNTNRLILPNNCKYKTVKVHGVANDFSGWAEGYDDKTMTIEGNATAIYGYFVNEDGEFEFTPNLKS